MCTGRGSNQGPLGPKSDALTTAPLRLLIVPCLGKTRITCRAGCFFFFFEKAKRYSFISFQMGKFREKRKVGLKFGRHKKSTYTTAKATTSASTQFRSPVHKRARVSSTPCKIFASPCVGYKSTSIRERKL